MKNKLLVAAFAAVATLGIGAGVYTLVPPFNGAQKDAAWAEKAITALQGEIPPHAKVEFVSAKNVAKAEGKYASKVLTFKVKGPFGHFSKTAEVRCDQEKTSNGLRGGDITCGRVEFSNPSFGWNV